jgi:hypothetical protein
VPATPWSAVVTLIDKDQFLVTLHRNGRLAKTVLVDRDSLFFPSPVAGLDPAPAAAYVEIIDRCGLLTIAAAVILVSMATADKRSPLQTGLNGATRWESVAGQVLATGQGLGGNEAFSKALLDRARDVDPGNMAASVARVNMDGRRATDAESRKDFAVQISKMADSSVLKQRGYEALQLRVLYSSAAGWCNSYLDDRTDDSWNQARRWTAQLIGKLYTVTTARRSTAGRTIHSLASSMKSEAYILWKALGGFYASPPPEGFGHTSQAVICQAVRNWEPKGPQTSSISYAQACLAAVKHCYDAALQNLKEAVEIDDGLRTWAQSDPSFKALRTDRAQEFLAIVGDRPPESFTEITPMAKYTQQLSDIGVHSADDLISMTSSDTGLELFAEAVDVPQLVVARWRNIAGLASIASGPNPGQLDLLIAAGVDSVSALLAAVDENLSRLVSDLGAAGINSSVEIDAEDLSLWGNAVTD